MPIFIFTVKFCDAGTQHRLAFMRGVAEKDITSFMSMPYLPPTHEIVASQCAVPVPVTVVLVT